MTRLSMIALAAGLSGLATAAMAQQTNQPPPPSGPYQAGQWSPGYGQQPATQAQTEAPKAGEARGAPEAAPPGWGAPRRRWPNLRAVQARIAEGRWRENAQAKDWVGYAVASVLKLDASNKAHRAKIKAMLKQWIANGALVVVDGEDAKRNKRSFVEVGTPVDE